jgi:dUTP pyrophosphatase
MRIKLIEKPGHLIDCSTLNKVGHFVEGVPQTYPPIAGTAHSAGLDLRLAEIKGSEHGVYTLALGVAVEIPENHFGLLAVRSSVGAKGLQMTNSVGIIDSDYRGELMMKCTFTHRGFDFPELGDRVAQLVVLPYVKFEIEIVEELNKTVRGEGGYGSTGN